MNGTLGRDKLWNQQIWDDIDNAVRDEVGRIRVAQKVFPCTLLPSGQYVPADKVGSGSLSIEEGETKPFVEIWVEFTLTQSQVDSEESLHTARTLARMAANKVATAEDALLFRGRTEAASLLKLRSMTHEEDSIRARNADRLEGGFLGEAKEADPYARLEDLKNSLRTIVKSVPDHSGIKKFKDDLRSMVNKTDVNKKFGDLKGRLRGIAESVLQDEFEELKTGLEQLLGTIPAEEKKVEAKLEGILARVPHKEFEELKTKLESILGSDSNSNQEFKELETELRGIVKSVPDHVAVKKLKDDLEDFVKSVSHDVEVKGSKDDPEILVRSVFDGIAKLRENAHVGPYALFLPLRTFADAFAPLPRTLESPADRIIPLVTGGFFGTGCLPENQGLLVSLGGEPTTIYIGIDATTAFTQIKPNGIYQFRVFERIQFVARDPRAFLIFTFR